MTIALFTPLPAGPNGDGGFAQARDRARAAQDGGIDALILPDRRSVGPDGPDGFEAGTLAAALAVATEGIGLVPTIATEYSAPYHVARLLATIDQFAGGRAGWAIAPPAVAADAANHHTDAPAPLPSQRARADEFAQVMAGLWDSFQDDAFLRDRASGVYFLPERLRSLDHRGEYFTVAGPLNIARPPQGHPVLVRRVSCAEDAASAAAFGDLAIVPLEVSDAAADVARALNDACGAAGRRREDVRLLLERRADTPVDELLREAEAGPADGFVLVPSADAGFETVLETARAVRQEFPQGSGTTLRARLGLPRPAGR
ncbi:alkanesulfonate monooxygenase SsuD/methylene tetrahydromethanopterin reductase-like flavin-dependent oxidoreductase (luciferase family) [Kitasatospora sp. MAA19]|uniref:LLM class flavin-dependent oxidoreductase n=1 Tax=Kitasatospora sp. MAA19 TaxID=3035090 RepID=UPI0024731775|nr:LLM class flavin-dependent oxidoreductase [Kitasatospora sp. MAA19]MDH6707213.1 alkanesulfonate monooxygenase SsuD/methylene tetrahydromethanopterin reductase-like flavin-dependent oxidoreductase (luciferase family) [Kitasatospora sp. MAA19]